MDVACINQKKKKGGRKTTTFSKMFQKCIWCELALLLKPLTCLLSQTNTKDEHTCIPFKSKHVIPILHTDITTVSNISE